MSVRFAAMNELGPGAVVGGWRVERVLGATVRWARSTSRSARKANGLL